MDLVDVKTGKATSVPDDHAEAAIRSGQYTFARGAQVAVRNEIGKIGHLPAEDAMRALAAGSVTLASPEAVRQHTLQREHGDVVGGLEAAGEGAARGLTLGVSDPLAIGAARALGGDDTAEAVRKHLADVKEANPITAGISELAGAAAPVLASGGAGAAAGGAEAIEGGSAAYGALRAAGAAPRAVSALGHGVEAGVRALLPEATSLLGRVGTSALATGASGAAEGALYGAGSQLSEDALNGGDHELTAEHLLAAMGHGALFGGAVGGALGAGTGLARAGLDSLSERLGGLSGPRVQGFLEDQANNQAWRSLSPGKRATEEAEKRAGGALAVGRTLREEGIFDAQSLREAARTPSDLLPRVQEAKERIGAELGSLVKESTGTVSAAEVLRPLEEIAQREGAKAGFEGVVRSIGDYRSSLIQKLGLGDLSRSIDALEATQRSLPGADLSARRAELQQALQNTRLPIADVYQQRKALDDLVYRESKALDPNLRVGLLREYRSQLADLELRSIEEAGGPSYTEAKALRQRYQHLSLAESALEKTTSAYQTNRNVSMSGYLSAVGAAAAGHPLAAPVVAIGHQIIKERGNAIAATFLNQLTHLGAVESASQQVEGKIASQLRGYLSRTAELVKRAAVPVAMHAAIGRSSRDLRASYERRAAQVQVEADPRFLQQRLTTNLGTLPKQAPKISTALAAKGASIASYLAMQLPQRGQGPSLLQSQLKGPPPSHSEMSRFLRIDSVVRKPLSLLDNMRSNMLTGDEVDAVAATSPKLLQQIREAALKHVAERSAEIPYEKRKALAVLLGAPTDPTLESPFMADIQSGYAREPLHPPQGVGGHGHAPKPGSIQIAQRSTTDFERSASAGDTTG